MKNLQFTLAFILCSLFFTQNTNAQTNPWILTGNVLNGTEKLGSTNAWYVRFFTNNVERMRLTDGANTNPSTLIIGNTSGLYDTDPNKTSIQLKLDIQNPIATTYGASVGARAKTAANGTNCVGTSEGYMANSSSWAAGGAAQGVLGISSVSVLKAAQGNSASVGGGFTANFSAAQLSSTGTYWNRSAGVMGALSGTITTFPTNGFVSAVAGVDGINTTNTWAGYFSGKVYCSASLFVASDARFKSNIKTLNGSLDLISKMRGVSYEYDQAKFSERSFIGGKTDGFLAQELREVMPELVHQGSDGYLSVNYIGVIPVLTEAVKELKAQKDADISTLEEQIADKDRQISELEARMAKLEELVATSRSAASINVSATATLIAQPNPFNEVTTINFTLPENVQNAAIMVTDVQGKVVMQQSVETRGAGKTTLSFNQLPAGTYACTLVADGQPVATAKVIYQNR